jgi:hypothetical protein
MEPKFCGCRDADTLVQRGPRLSVYVGFDPGFDPTIAGNVPDLRSREMNALVDTGSAVTCIDVALARELELRCVGTGYFTGMHGPSEANMYEAQIWVPALDYTMHGTFRAVRVTLGESQVLFGRDFLKQFTMVYEGHTGGVTLARYSTGT